MWESPCRLVPVIALLAACGGDVAPERRHDEPAAWPAGVDDLPDPLRGQYRWLGVEPALAFLEITPP